MKTLSQLTPQPVWNYFGEILKVPRPSKKEGKIISFLLDFAKKNNLEVKTDEVGNVLISKPATFGCGHFPTVVLQTHLDMVCEKNSLKVFDFETDAIEVVVGDEWVSASETTLGADDGIGIAAQMAVLTSASIKHGRVECLFTVDEETGLTGANSLLPDFFTGKILVNLDSEDEGELFIGCAGGIDTVAYLDFQEVDVPKGVISYKLIVGGLQGGHSGDDIHKGLGNANKILARFLLKAAADFQLLLADFNGGNLRNAIAREAFAVVLIPESKQDKFLSGFDKFRSEVKFEFEKTEPVIWLTAEVSEMPENVIDNESFSRLIYTLNACPHGVLEMSTRMPAMVETSTNLASVKFNSNQQINVTTSQRSEIESRKLMAATMVESVFKLAGAKVTHSDGYPGWAPNPDSEILKIAVNSYKSLFGNEPLVRSIHAGLECGLFLEKYPGLDMVSFGPTIKGAHSPSERINIETVQKFWDLLVHLLENVNNTGLKV